MWEDEKLQEKMIEILNKQLQLLDAVNTVNELYDWKNKTRIFICRIYPEKSQQYKLFNSISAYPSIYSADTPANVPGAVSDAKNVIQGFIEDIQAFGLPNNDQEKTSSKTTKPYISIENNLSQLQNQKQNQNINIEDILKDELPPAKMREIQNIACSNEPKESKLQKIGNILQKTGIEVVSTTLAKIITNSLGIF